MPVLFPYRPGRALDQRPAVSLYFPHLRPFHLFKSFFVSPSIPNLGKCGELECPATRDLLQAPLQERVVVLRAAKPGVSGSCSLCFCAPSMRHASYLDAAISLW